MSELMNIVMNIKSKITYMDITSCIRFKFMIIRLINIIYIINLNKINNKSISDRYRRDCK